jgi:acetoin utilization protein AcuB
MRTTHEESAMRVKELMTGAPITVTPETAVLEARRLMLKERIRHLIVLEYDRLVGIVTDRDIRLNLPSQATSLSVWEVNYLLARLTVGEVMSKTVLRVGPDRRVHEAARIMIEHKIGALPVVDGERVIGIVTETDILRAFVQSAQEPAGTSR